MHNDHLPVFLNEVVDSLKIVDNGIYFDCTFGRGGHSKAILTKLSVNAKLIAIDCDQTAYEYALANIKDDRFKIVKAKFSELENIIKSLQIKEVNGFVFDLGVSSPQLDNPKRGFSYHQEHYLDMRMDQTQQIDAHYIINHYSVEKLINIFRNYGESKYASIVAKAIVQQRQIKSIDTTMQLVDIIKKTLPKKELYQQKHPARVFFQAIRMEVNQEIPELEKGLTSALKYLAVGSRIVIISFHSLENQIIKQILKKHIKTQESLSYLPIENLSQFKLIKSPQLSSEELNQNPRARSARLHIIERIRDAK